MLNMLMDVEFEGKRIIYQH